jgi:WD40 repeat protein
VTAVTTAVVDGRPTVVSGGADGTVRLWDARSGAPRGEPRRGHDGPVMSVAVAVIDGQTVVISGGADAAVRLWGPATTTVLPVLSSVTPLSVVDGGLAVGTCSSLLVVDVPSLPAAARRSVGGDPTSSR